MSDCSCIYVEVDELPIVSTTAIHKARKEHTCCECNRTIVCGEEYEMCKMLHDGTWRNYKTCGDCVSVRKSFFCHGWYIGVIWDHIEEHISEIDGQLSSECFENLTKSARDKLCDLVEEYWEEEDEVQT